jgi:hypothetical protein
MIKLANKYLNRYDMYLSHWYPISDIKEMLRLFKRMSLSKLWLFTLRIRTASSFVTRSARCIPYVTSSYKRRRGGA